MSRPLPLRNRDFGLLWTGQVLSQAPTRMYQIALAWWIMQTAGPRAGLAMAGMLILSAIPAIIFVKPIGRLIDRSNTQRLLVITDSLAGIVALLLAFVWAFPDAQLPAVFVVAFLLSGLQSIIDSSLNKAIPEILPPEDIEAGVAFQSSTQAIAGVAGAVLGAALIDLIGVRAVIGLNAASYFVSAICNRVVTFRFPVPPSSPEDTVRAGWSLLDDLPFIRKLLVGFGLVNFFAAPLFVILPLYTRRVLDGSATMLAGLEASFSAALLVGTLSVGVVAGLRNTVTLGAYAMMTFGVFAAIPGFWTGALPYALSLFVMGVTVGIVNVRFVSLFQSVVPVSIKGRFFALLQALMSFSYPAAFFLFGLLGDIAVTPMLCVIQGFGVFVVGTWFWLLAGTKEAARLGQETT